MDLSEITIPFLNLAGKRGHIVHLPQAEAVMDLVGSEEKEFVLDAGYVGLLTGRGAKDPGWGAKGWPEPRSG